ncbi:MAG: ClpX C4-type zinc finger protein [Actinomycetota bacterium]|jgi:ATP-dependent Clp protease ATP-binding subunit ClpX|nr:ClpX C4-type zinc finger protein [Actinomycetota bacterium]
MPTATLLACSFCLRTADEVDRLLGGDGAFICDACVGECDRILADPSIPFPSFEGDEVDALLRRLAPAAGRVEAAASGLRGLVDVLRQREVSWARIGEALGVSRQAAWERFG